MIPPKNYTQTFKRFKDLASLKSSIWKRSFVEYLQRYRGFYKEEWEEKPKVIYMTGMPRTGSSLMKNYLGSYPGMQIMPFQKNGFHATYSRARRDNGSILIDKSTGYIEHPGYLFHAYGKQISMFCIVRDPRDQYLSLLAFKGHIGQPRNTRFWHLWHNRYSKLINFIQENPHFKIALLRYEDLVRFPIDAKSFFVTWAGLDATLEPISDTYKVAYQDDIQDNKVVLANKPLESSIGKYLKISDPCISATINYYKKHEKIRNLMKQFGYSDRTTSPTLQSEINIFRS